MRPDYTIGESLLKVDSVFLDYGDKKVLRDVNIDIKDIIGKNQTIGQVIALLGKSGIGKSQLFKIMAGLIKPTSGHVLVGHDQIPVVAGVVGMVLQTYPLYKHRTLKGNLELVCKDPGKIDFYLEQFDIWEHRNKYLQELSGGQRQRTAIVQQLLCSEHFILLDEPFSGLDPIATEKLCKVISKVASADSSNTIIISSHILEPTIAISDTILMLGNEFKDGVKVEGANIRHTEDLAAQGLAWNPDIRKDPRFGEMIEKIRSIFYTI